MGKLFDSIGSFFGGGDQIPWCDRDVIAVSFGIPCFPQFISPLFPHAVSLALCFQNHRSTFSGRDSGSVVLLLFGSSEYFHFPFKCKRNFKLGAHQFFYNRFDL